LDDLSTLQVTTKLQQPSCCPDFISSRGDQICPIAIAIPANDRQLVAALGLPYDGVICSRPGAKVQNVGINDR
jgi:hypothetical protein